MKRLLLCAGALFVALATMGCHRPFYDSAEAPDGGRYVVGADGGKAAVWWCPTQKGECKRMALEVTE